MTVSPPIEQRVNKSASDPRLHFVHVPTPGDHYSAATGSAVPTVIYELARCHAAAGYKTTILLSKGATVGYPPYPVGEVREIALPTSLPPKSLRVLEAGIARIAGFRPFTAGRYAGISDALGRDFDGMIFIHNSPAAMPLLRSKLPQASLVLYAHNQLFNTYSPREVRRVLDCCNSVICVSNFIAQNITTRAQVQSSKLKIVLNGVDTERFTPAPTPPADIPVVLFLGRTLREKGPDLLLKAAAQIATAAPPFKVRIIGSSNFDPHAPLTPYEQELRHLAEPIKDRVEFVATLPRDKIIAEFHKASVYVVPSNWDDPCPLTVLEGLACGLPMIASRRGGIPEEGGESVRYFDPSMPSELSEHLLFLLQNPDERLKQAKRARARGLEVAWSQSYDALFRGLGK